MERIETAQISLSPWEVDQMLAAYGSRMTAVGERFGVHESTVRAHAKRRCVVRPPTVPSVVLTEYAAEVPVRELAQRCGVSVDTIVRHARRNGIVAPAGGLTLGQVAEIVELYRPGVRIVDITKRFKAGHHLVRQILIYQGVQIRPSGRRPGLMEHQDEVARLRAEG